MSGPLTRRASLKRIAFAAAACSLPDIFRPVASYGADVPPQPTPTDAEHAAIANVAQQFMDKFQVPGLSVAVARHGQFVYSKGFGLADTSGEKLTPSHLFRIASVT